MNCTQVGRLLALYVEGDIDGARCRDVAAHLQFCDACRRLSDEFAASQSILRLHATPPRFEAAFFDGIRQNVLRELAQEFPRPSLASSFRQFLAPRSFALTAAGALLFGVCALVATWRFDRDGASPASQTTTASTAAQSSADCARPASSITKSAAGTAALSKRSNGAALMHALKVARRQKARVSSAPSPPAAAAGAAAVAAVTAPEQRARATEFFAHGAVASTERKWMRIELQTGDPNVRIIWLAPQTADTLKTRKQINFQQRD